MSVEFDEVWVLLLFYWKTHSRCLVSSDKLSGESQTICARLVTVLLVVALCEVGVYDDWSSSLSICVGFL